MARRRDPVTGKLLPEGIYPVVSERTGKVTYRARVNYMSGRMRKHKSKTHQTPELAIEWKLETELRVNGGDILDDSRVTVAEYYAAWFARRSEQWSGSRQRGVASSWRHHVEPEIGHLRVRDVKRRHIQRLVNRITDSGCSSRSASIYMAGVRALFRSAVIDEIIPRNPCHDLEYPKDEVQKRPTWSVLELRRYIGHLHTSDAEYRTVLMFIAATGCRIGEALAMRWEDVDIENGTVWIHRTLSSDELGRLRLVDRTKTTADGRVIPIPHWLCDVLATMHEPAGLIWSDGGGLILPNYVRDEHYAIIDKLKLKPIRVHDIRHTVGSLLHASGVDHQTIQEYLGHEDPTQTRKYIHPHLSRLRSGVESVSRSLGFDSPNATTQDEKSDHGVNIASETGTR